MVVQDLPALKVALKNYVLISKSGDFEPKPGTSDSGTAMLKSAP